MTIRSDSQATKFSTWGSFTFPLGPDDSVPWEEPKPQRCVRGGRLAAESRSLPSPARLVALLQAVPPGPGGRAPEPHLACAQAGPADSPEAAVLSRGLQAGVWTAGGAEDRPQFSQGQGLFWVPELGLTDPRAAPACTVGFHLICSLAVLSAGSVCCQSPALPHSSGPTLFHTISFPSQMPVFLPMTYDAFLSNGKTLRF